MFWKASADQVVVVCVDELGILPKDKIDALEKFRSVLDKAAKKWMKFKCAKFKSLQSRAEYSGFEG